MLNGNIDILDVEGELTPSIALSGTINPIGPAGPKGDDGFSPIANVETITGGATITITDKEGTTTATIYDGQTGPAGADGEDGYSPSASVTKSDGKSTITITDKTGTTTAEVTDGVDGQDGADGFSPTASVTKSGSTATISITDKNGTTTATVSDGEDGSPGAPGQDGQDGEDGYSPTATVSKSGKVATITITDKNGTTTTEIRDGEDGQGSGDMLKSTYDTDNDGIVDNAEACNGHTLGCDVPSNAVFTDTTYTAGTGIDITNGVISNTQTSANWGNITGTLSDQTDLKNALDAKQGTLTAGSNIQINSGTISATDTTYESKTASQGGTDVSLCTTGEKYTWNNKQNALSSQTAYTSKGSATKVPQITTNSLGQVTGITEVTITQPTVNNATLTIQKNGTTVNTFTANASSNVTANITVPTKTSDITNDSGFVTNEVTVGTTQPSDSSEIWIDPTSTPAVEGASVVSVYSTGHDKVYDCDYLNTKFSNIDLSEDEVVVGTDHWGNTLYRKTLYKEITNTITNLRLDTIIPSIALVEKIDYSCVYDGGQSTITGNTNINDGSTSFYSLCFYNFSGSAHALRFFFGASGTYALPDYVLATIYYIKN